MERLIRRGFSQCDYEPCLFSKNGVIILVYVHDCLFFGKNGQILDEMIEDLKKEFDLKHEGDVGAFWECPNVLRRALRPANTVPLGRLEARTKM